MDAAEAPDPRADPTRRTTTHFFALNALIAVALCVPFVRGHPLSGASLLYQLALLATYPLLYLTPAWLLAHLARWTGRLAGLGSAAVAPVAILGVLATDALLILDSNVHRLYGFHLNGFVWNLVTTRGGLASLGLSTSAVVTAILGLGLMVAIQAGTWRAARQLALRFGNTGGVRLPGYRAALVLVLVIAAAERITFGIADLRRSGDLLAAAKDFPLYNGSTFEGLATRLGFEVEPRRATDWTGGGGALAYPLSELELEPPAEPLNFVWLVAESWRWDTLTPEIMPATSAFARRAQRFDTHYSGGNGTRMGVFSMFYGLYPTYWFSILDANRGPVFIDALLAQGYQTRMFTSAHFTYPEFDRTVFARIPDGDLVEAGGGKGWERDRRNVDDLLSFLSERDPGRPFMTFLFFESPHARYYFPGESVIREPYLEDFNYATMNLERDIDLIHNRYLNSCHHLDEQFGRILERLEADGLLDSTVVILTGDHGEEFMEKGHWGHGSTFSEEQVRVPLVLWVPGRSPRRVDSMTSHLDLPATVLPLVGATNPPEQLSHGRDLLGPERRDHTVIGDWSRVCLVDEGCKLVFPMKAAGLFRTEATRRDDGPLAQGDPMASRTEVVAELLREMARFRP